MTRPCAFYICFNFQVILVGSLIPWAALNVIFIKLWIYMVRVDPSAQGGVVVRSGQSCSTHYCSICRKTVTGFDHHCQWLSTCISLRNYLQFYLLCVVGAVLYFLQTVIGLLAIAYWETDSNGSSFNASPEGRSLWILSSLFDCIIGVCFSSLVGFHTYLICKGMGTYDYVIKAYENRNTTVL